MELRWSVWNLDSECARFDFDSYNNDDGRRWDAFSYIEN